VKVWRSVDEVAEYAHVDVDHVRAALSDRSLEGVTTHPRSPGHWMIEQDALDRWMATEAPKPVTATVIDVTQPVSRRHTTD
jgi:excisionase family DNA binding protein